MDVNLGEKESKSSVNKVGQEQIHGLLFGEKLSWQAIIYDLINSEQLDPWDVDVSLLANKYLGKVRELEEHDFFVSSKVLLAATLLLRIKSEILLNFHLKSLDDILFGREKEKQYKQERIELGEEVPELVPRTPLPRFRRVTLQELMSALGKAIKTETRRIKRVVVAKQQEFEIALSLPKKRINLRDKIREIYSKLKSIFSKRKEKLAFSEFSKKSREDRISTFVSLLHLDNQQRVWLEQENHFDEIWIWLKSLYEKQNIEARESMKKEVESEMEKLYEEEEDNKRKEKEKKVKKKPKKR
jgi:segregation and condensation protein A